MCQILSCVLPTGETGYISLLFPENESFARTIWLLNSSPEAVQFAGSSFASLATKEEVKVTDEAEAGTVPIKVTAFVSWIGESV